jgi:hypothetical protein
LCVGVCVFVCVCLVCVCINIYIYIYIYIYIWAVLIESFFFSGHEEYWGSGGIIKTYLTSALDRDES